MMILIGLALKSLLIAAATLALLYATRRRSAADRSWIAHLGLFALVALPLASLALPALSIEIPTAMETVVPAAAPAPAPETVSADFVEPALVATPLVTATPVVEAPAIDWTPIAYAVPVIALLGLTLIALLRLFGLRRRAQVMVDPHWLSALAHAQRRMGFKNGTALLVSSELASPISWGLMRPVILINDEALAAGGEAEAIIAHELAHVARFDWAKLMLARVATAMFWFNPLAWLLAREAHQLREEAADDAVLAANVIDTDYAQLLVGIARHEAKGLLLGAHGISPGKDSLRRRVRRVLDSSLARGAGGRSWVAGFAAGMLVMSAPLAALTFAPTPAAPPAPPEPAEAPPATARAPAAPSAPLAPHAPMAPLAPAAPGARSAATPPAAPLPPAAPHHPAPPPAPVAPLEHAIAATVSSAVSRAMAATAEATRALSEERRIGRARPRAGRDVDHEMRLLGVTPEYIARIKSTGGQFRNLDKSELIDLRVKGVTPEFIRAVRAAGYGHESADEIGDAAVMGMTPDALRAYARIAPRRSLGDLTELKMMGVSPDYLKALKRNGGEKLSKEQLIELRLLGHRRREVDRTP